MPEKILVTQINIIIVVIDSKNGIMKRHEAEPKNPIELTIFLTFIILLPFFIKSSARNPPALRAITEIILGIIIKVTNALDSRAIPNSLSRNFGKKDKKTKRLQLFAKVAATIAKKGLFERSFLNGIFLAVDIDGAFFSI